MEEKQPSSYGSYGAYGTYGGYGQESGAPFDVSVVYFALRERLWLIAACIFVLTGLGVAYIGTATKTYRATAVVEVASDTQQETVNIQDVKQEDSRTTEYLKTIEQSLVSPGLLVRVAKKDRVVDNEHYFPKSGAPYNDDQIARVMEHVASSKLRRGARLIDLSVTYTDPVNACKIAEDVVKEYLDEGIQRRLNVMTQANQVLSDEAEVLRKRVGKSEQALQEYMEQHNAVSLEDSQNIVVDQLKELNIEVSKAKNDRLTAESEYGQYLTLASRPSQELLTIQTIAQSPAVIQLRKGVIDQEAEIANLSKRYRVEHPKYIQAQSQLAALEKSLDRGILEAANGLKTNYQAAQATEQKLQDALKAAEARALELNKLSIPYNVISREVDSNRALYEAVLKRMREADITKGIVQENVQLVESPVVPVKPSSPKKGSTLLLCVMAGGGVGCGLAYLLYALDGAFKTVDEVEARTNLPVIAAIPKSKKQKFDRKSLVLVATPRSPIAESFRSLRTALSVRGGEQAPRIVLITSAVPAEGKSFCAANYAVALAQQEHRTLLIDADLRRPRIGRAFGFDPKSVGLTDCLRRNASIEEAVQSTEVENLFVMTAGSFASKPSEVLGRERLAAIIGEISARFDRVVLDTAPINAVSDTLLLLSYVHAICMVIRADGTSRRAVMRACHEITEAGGKEMGVILNCLPRRGGRQHHYHYSVGYYGDEGVYADSDAAA